MMQVVAITRKSDQIKAVALKAYGRIVDAWALRLKDTAGLADMSESTWKRA
jgi:phage tail protein X